MNRIKKIAKEIILAQYKEWTKEEWMQYKKDHPDTGIQPKFKQEPIN